MRERKAKRSKSSRGSSKSKYRRRMEKLKAGPKWKLDEYRRKQAERQRAYRTRHGK